MSILRFIVVVALLGLAFHLVSDDDPIKDDCIKRGGAPVHVKGEPHCYDVGHKGVNE